MLTVRPPFVALRCGVTLVPEQLRRLFPELVFPRCVLFLGEVSSRRQNPWLLASFSSISNMLIHYLESSLMPVSFISLTATCSFLPDAQIFFLKFQFFSLSLIDLIVGQFS